MVRGEYSSCSAARPRHGGFGMSGVGARGRGSRFFTVVVVPHSDGEVVSFRLPILAAQVLCTLVAAFWIALLVFVNSYLDLLTALDELVYLRAATREYHDRLQDLAQRAAAMERELEELAALDRQVRQLLAQAPFQHLARRGAGGGAAAVPPVQLAAAASGDRPLALGLPGVQAAGGPDLDGLEAQILRLSEEAGRRAASLDQLRTALEDQQRLYESTPTLWPVRGLITSPFGWRQDPLAPWRRDYHTGIDIAAPAGTPVVAAAAGVVVFAGWDGALGRVVTIDHGAYVTRYGHNSRLAVKPGQRVAKGEVIAYVGSSGRSTGPHLHYEVYLHGRLLNPRHFLIER